MLVVYSFDRYSINNIRFITRIWMCKGCMSVCNRIVRPKLSRLRQDKASFDSLQKFSVLTACSPLDLLLLSIFIMDLVEIAIRQSILEAEAKENEELAKALVSSNSKQ